MADEIAQVCQLEFEGVKYVIKGGVEVAQLLARMIRALIDFDKWALDKAQQNKLTRPGEKEISQIMKMSEGAPMVLQIKTSMLDEVLRIGAEKGLHFSNIMDLNPNDGLTPILVPAQESAIWGAIFKAVAEQELTKDETVVAGYSKQIAELQEKLLNASPEEKEKIQTQIENLTQAKEEANEWLNYDKDIIDNEKHGAIPFLEYLKEAKDTEFEKNPEKAVAELEQGVELGKKLSAKECFQPVRDKGLVPGTSFFFYLPDIGSVVTRQFETDKETGLIYSNYALKTANGEVYQFTDHNMTKDAWNEQILPQMLDKAGMIEGTPCRMFDDQEKLRAYVTKHDQVKTEAEKQIEEKVRSGEPVFTSAEAEREIKYAMEQKQKGLASAWVDENIVTISLDPNKMFRQSGRLSIRLDDGQTLMIGNLQNERIENGKATFDIKKDEAVILAEPNAKDLSQWHQITGEQCVDIINRANAAHTPELAKKQGSHR